MSDKHVHEWWITDDLGRIGAKCGCGEEMTGKEVWRRLNSTERLSAEDALYARVEVHKHNPVHDALMAYAKALEGDDE